MTSAQLPNLESIEFGKKLRSQTVACRLHTAKLGTRRALTRDQVRTAAAGFHADVKALSASKKLVDTSHPAYREVTSVLRRAKAYWKSLTVPYPDKGTRLLLRDRVEDFNKQMERYQAALEEAVQKLQENYAEIRAQAQQTLGDLFDPYDYPGSLVAEFELGWDWPNIEPPAYLKSVHPELYKQEMARIQSRFEEAVALTEQAFVNKFHDLVARLSDRLKGGVDGKPKVFQASTVENLQGFFDEFKSLDIGSSHELTQLIEQAQAVVGGLDAKELRSNEALRESVGGQLGGIEEALGSMMVDRPGRAIDLDDEDDE